MNQLYQRHILRLCNLTNLEILKLIEFSSLLKNKKKEKKEIKYLTGKNIVLIFEKESTRTRCACEVAAFDQGANITYLDDKSTHFGYKESIQDSAQILSKFYDGILYRGTNHKTIEILSRYSQVPVWNGLTEQFHPTQLLADLLTIKEYTMNKKNYSDIKIAYVGDARNNISNSILEAASLINFDLRFIAPKKYWPNEIIFKQCIKNNKNTKIICTENILHGVQDVDFIYTDVWVSMGEKQEIWEERINLLKDYQVNENMLMLTNNPNVKVLHCLPAMHDNKTVIGNTILTKYNLKNGVEISNKVFNLNKKIIFEQSENRLHTIKALMIATLKNHYI